MTRKKILLLSVSAGAGHTRAAQAIQSTATLCGADASVTHLDVMDYVTAGFRKIYICFYLFLIDRLPMLWGYFYRVTDEAKPGGAMQRWRRRLEWLNTGPLRKKIVICNPDAIICTHFLPVEIVSGMIGKGAVRCQVWVQVTDFDLHRMWVSDHVTGYFAASEEVAFRMRMHGVAPARIHVTGIPIILDSSVGQVRVCVFPVAGTPDSWLGATTTQTPF